MTSRRNFLKGILAAAMAPAICKAENLMKIAVPKGFIESDTGMYIPCPEPSIFDTDMVGDFTTEAWINPNSEWSHFAIVRNSGALKTYLNGKEVPHEKLAKPLNGLRLTFNNGNLTVEPGKFNGYIDELKITTVAKPIGPKLDQPDLFGYPLILGDIM